MEGGELLLFIVFSTWCVNVTSFLLDDNKKPVKANCHQTINDPLWPEQWFLNASAEEYDINVLPAWNKCYNGTGIIVAVVDTGVDNINVDLVNKVLPINIGTSSNPNNSSLESQHGTEIAGLIAAEANDQFGRGIAFGASIADFPYVDPHTDEDIPNGVLKLHHNIIDIYSCSFSRLPDGFSIYKMGKDVRSDLQFGTSMGRQNRGSIYVVSSGNGGEYFYADSCAYQEFMNNEHVILVAGVNHILQPIVTGEKCSAIMVTAPTRLLGKNIKPSLITLSGNNYTDNFGMTSAAVAMVSGSIAIMLSANERLTYRDVMHILTRTARSNFKIPYKQIDEPFRCNDAGFAVSSQYGFGLIDVHAMVEEAQRWKTVGNKFQCVAELGTKNIMLTTKAFVKVEYSCPIIYLEHVEVQMIISARGIGHSKVLLRAPGGYFHSKILPGRFLDRRKFMNITVVSVQFWGHNPKGLWDISILDEDDKLDTIAGKLVDVKITFHGLSREPTTPRRNSCGPTKRQLQEKDKYFSEEENDIPPGRSSADMQLSARYIYIGLPTLLYIFYCN